MGMSNRSKILIVSVSILLFLVFWILVTQLKKVNQCQEYDFIPNFNSDDTNSVVYLTNFIKREELIEGRVKASVGNWKGVPSFSGYFTVNETTNSNLFFWFFPVSSYYNESEKAPLILYLQGGPGMTSMLGLFLETGPFYLDEGKYFQKRKYAWTETHSVLYIDSPVSTGFSYSNDSKSYPTTTDAVAHDLFEALIQFFTIFEEYQEKQFYIAGTSYCGKYIPILAHLIHKKNENDPKIRINLKGLAIGGGYFDAAIQDKFAEFNYYLGFIDKKQQELCEKKEDEISILINEKKFEEARSETLSLKNLTSTISGWGNFLLGNGLEMETSHHVWNFYKFLELSCVKQALHVEINKTFVPISDISIKYSRFDYYRSTRPELETLLNENYKVLIFASQFDMVVPHFGISKFLDTLNWTRSDEYFAASRSVWKVNGTIAGYVKKVKGLTFTLLRNGGHMPCLDNSFWCFDMINQFTSEN